MKGLLIKGVGSVEFRDDLPIPELEEGEALIRVKYAGVCGSDLRLYRTGIDKYGGEPYILGHEFVGTVVASKDNGKVPYKIGDFVTALTYRYCNECEPCENGRTSICEAKKNCGFGLNGTYAEYVKVKCRNVYKFREDINPKVAALTEPYAVAVFDLAKSGFRAGQTVFISGGGGPIGTLLAIHARYAGASNIVISELNEKRAQALRNMGFKTMNPMADDAVEQAIAINNGRKFDIAFEIPGIQSSFDFIFKVLKRGGTLMPTGIPTKRTEIDIAAFSQAQFRMVGVNLYDIPYFTEAVNIINSGRLDAELLPLVTDIYPMDQATDAYMKAMDPAGNHVKVLIDCEDS